MAKLLYFDCPSGASGDMILGALLDAGLPIEALRRALGSLAIEGCTVSAARVDRAGIAATRFLVGDAGTSAPGGQRAEPAPGGHHHPHPHHHPHDDHEHDPHGPGAAGHGHDAAPAAPPAGHAHRSLAEIHALIERSALSAAARARARALFERLAEAEAAIHQVPLDRVHLHEVGALDSIIDIVGAVFGLEWFGCDQIAASPLNVGGGQVECAHGTYPVPAPATLRLLAGTPIYARGPAAELVTPTGALLVTAYASAFGPLPAMTVERVGYGAGARDFAGFPNVLRVLVGEAAADAPIERVAVLEFETDDMNPQLFGPLMERLYDAGALEVFYVPVQMKKNRPGTLVTIVAPVARRELLQDLVFTETTTIGVRYQDMLRERLDRELVTVQTPLGAIRVKVARRSGRVVNAAPEFDDCARLAAAHGRPAKEVHALAIKAYIEENEG